MLIIVIQQSSILKSIRFVQNRVKNKRSLEVNVNLFCLFQLMLICEIFGINKLTEKLKRRKDQCWTEGNKKETQHV